MALAARAGELAWSRSCRLVGRRRWRPRVDDGGSVAAWDASDAGAGVGADAGEVEASDGVR